MNWLVAIVTVFFPQELPDDSCGYCLSEFRESKKLGGKWYELHHHSQGHFYTNAEAYAFFTGASSSPYKGKDQALPHSTNIRKLKYSWADLPILVLDPNRDQAYQANGCWNRGG